MEKPEVLQTKLTTTTIKMDLNAEQVEQIILLWAETYGFDRRKAVLTDDEYWYRGVSISQTVEDTSSCGIFSPEGVDVSS